MISNEAFKEIFERTLIISPHFDDETIGCGGLLRKINETYGMSVNILFLTTSVGSVSAAFRFGEAVEALKYLDKMKTTINTTDGYIDGYLEDIPFRDIVTRIDKYITEMRPTAVLFPYASHHQDHQVVNRASIAACRSKIGTNFIKLKAMYEYPYITGYSDMSHLSKIYVPLTGFQIDGKKESLSKYRSQMNEDERDPLNISSIVELSKTRGRECGEYYAEAFYIVGLKI